MCFDCFLKPRPHPFAFLLDGSSGSYLSLKRLMEMNPALGEGETWCPPNSDVASHAAVIDSGMGTP